MHIYMHLFEIYPHFVNLGAKYLANSLLEFVYFWLLKQTNLISARYIFLT